MFTTQYELGGTDYEEVGKPYDIRVTVQGVARRCEVKGSSMEIDTVALTVNEVDHGTSFAPIDLIVVDKIVPIRHGHGQGNGRHWWAAKGLGRLDAGSVGPETHDVRLQTPGQRYHLTCRIAGVVDVTRFHHARVAKLPDLVLVGASAIALVSETLEVSHCRPNTIGK